MLARTGTRNDIDRLARQLAHGDRDTDGVGAVIAVDAWRDDHALYLQFDLPGMDRSSIDLTTERDTLTLTAERPSPVPEGARPVLTERPTGRFSRCLTLSDAFEAQAAEATYDNGVLTLRIPLAAHARPRRIPVTGGPRKQITP